MIENLSFETDSFANLKMSAHEKLIEKAKIKKFCGECGNKLSPDCEKCS